MAFTTANRFSFLSQGMPEDTFGVIGFDGSEGLSLCYRFEIQLVSDQPSLNLRQVLGNPASFTIHRNEGDIPFHGILAEFEQLHAFNQYVFFRAVLVPRFWWLGLTFHNQVFLDKTLPEILDAVLKDGGLTGNDFELRLQKDYPTLEYVCQYGESHFDFVSRWMERDGIYYFFEQTSGAEKLILTDTQMAHTAMPEGQNLIYSPPSGLDATHMEEIIVKFSCRQRMLPAAVHLKDYNYRTPSLEISGQSPVVPDGRGEIYVYGDHFRTPEQGRTLADIRADEYRCREQLFQGDSTIPFIRPGYTFDLENHYRDDFNQKYLTIEAQHQGNQAAYMISGIQKALSAAEQEPYYRNTFNAIPARQQFRPERKTGKARIYGVMNARIDASGTGQYAELDSEGRYKVILPFDLSGRKNGKASAFLRMMQPYGGTNHGMHFPLHKGTEVVLIFIDGDPDRPMICGAVPNPETPSLIKDENQTQCHITTGGQNRFHIEDQAGSERMLMHTPKANTWFRMGTPNDPEPTTGGSEGEGGEDDGFTFSTDGCFSGLVGAVTNWDIKKGESKKVAGFESTMVLGWEEKLVTLVKTDQVIGLEVGLKMGGGVEFSPLHHQFRSEEAKLKAELTELKGEVNTLDGSVNYLGGEVTRLEGETQRLAGEVTTLDGSVTYLGGEVTKLEGETTRLAGETTRLDGEVTTLQGEVTTLDGSVTYLGGEVTKLEGETTRLSGEVTRLDGETTNLASNRTVLAAIVIIM